MSADNNTGWMKIGLLVICIAALVWVWAPRPKYPKISSRESDRLIRLLATSCGSQNKELLQQAKDELTTLKLPDSERQSFEKIIRMADDGNWKGAHQASIQFAQDQVR